MAVLSFFAGLPYEIETANYQVLSSEITSLKDVFSRVLRTQSTPSTPSNKPINYFVNKGGGHSAGRRNNNKGGAKATKLGHTKQYC